MNTWITMSGYSEQERINFPLNRVETWNELNKIDPVHFSLHLSKETKDDFFNAQNLIQNLRKGRPPGQ